MFALLEVPLVEPINEFGRVRSVEEKEDVVSSHLTSQNLMT